MSERSVKACIECELKIFDGNGFSESDKVGRPSDPKPEIMLSDLAIICRERGVLKFRMFFWLLRGRLRALCVLVVCRHGRCV